MGYHLQIGSYYGVHGRIADRDVDEVEIDLMKAMKT